MLMLPNWSPNPRQSPGGLAGLFLVLAFLLVSLDGISSGKRLLLCSGLFLGGFGLCLFSLARERSKLYGYTGMMGAVLYTVGNVMAFLVGPGKLGW